MPSPHLDILTKQFLSGAEPISATDKFDPFKHVQDPTYITFNLDFFPDGGESFPDDYYSSGGLFRPRGPFFPDDILNDSAAEYLARIGAPSRQAYLEIFINFLYNIQNDAPWFFQSITGVGELYKIDPAVNFRGKDKILTIECLESVDMRLSILADAYRNVAFDMEYMREILPINLRTFNMAIHVLEFRNFNTTFGVIADALSTNRSQSTGQVAQERTMLQWKNSGIKSPVTPPNNIVSAFDAISVQTYYLKDCEFDFFSEAPAYLDTLSVADIPAATSKFKIKVGKIQKVARYPFYKYVIAEYTKFSIIDNTKIKSVSANRTAGNLSKPYFDNSNLDTNISSSYFSDIKQSIFQSDEFRTWYNSYVDGQHAMNTNNIYGKPFIKGAAALLNSFLNNVENAIPSLQKNSFMKAVTNASSIAMHTPIIPSNVYDSISLKSLIGYGFKSTFKDDTTDNTRLNLNVFDKIVGYSSGTEANSSIWSPNTTGATGISKAIYVDDTSDNKNLKTNVYNFSGKYKDNLSDNKSLTLNEYGKSGPYKDNLSDNKSLTLNEYGKSGVYKDNTSNIKKININEYGLSKPYKDNLSDNQRININAIAIPGKYKDNLSDNHPLKRNVYGTLIYTTGTISPKNVYK